MMLLSLTVPAEYAGQRLDKVIPALARELSRSAVQKIIESGGVTVNGCSPDKKTKLSCGDRIGIEVPDPEILDAVPQNIPIDIVY